MGIECSDVQVYRDDFTDKSKNPVVFTGDKESARNYIGNVAFLYNGGHYIFEKRDNIFYYNCGNCILYTYEKIDLEPKFNSDFLGYK